MTNLCTTVTSRLGQFDFLHPDETQRLVTFYFSTQAARALGFDSWTITLDPDRDDDPAGEIIEEALLIVKRRIDRMWFSSHKEQFDTIYDYFQSDEVCQREWMGYLFKQRRSLRKQIHKLQQKLAQTERNLYYELED